MTSAFSVKSYLFLFFFLCYCRYETSNRACAQSLHQTAAIPACLHFLLHDGCLLAGQSHSHFYHLSSAPAVHPVIFTAPGCHHPCPQTLGTRPRSAELFQPSRPAGVQPPPPAAAQTQTAEEEGFHHHQGHDSASSLWFQLGLSINCRRNNCDLWLLQF